MRPKAALGLCLYSHWPTNDSYNKYIHCYCLPCNYVTKPLDIFQRVIKSLKVCISFGRSKCLYLFSQGINMWLNLHTYFYIFKSNEKEII